jgi:hypothetical protein
LTLFSASECLGVHHPEHEKYPTMNTGVLYAALAHTCWGLFPIIFSSN